MTAPVVDAVRLHRFFHSGDEETQALRDVSLRVLPGEFVAIVGPSGSGKSTLLHCLSGLDEPDGGTVTVDGTRISRQPESDRAELRARLVGIVTQRGNLFDHLTVTQNVALARRVARPRRGTATGPTVPASKLLAELGIEHRQDARPSTLSGGESVRAALAMALANDPRVLAADEPTGELDSATERHILAMLRERTANGLALVMASHSRAVTDAADRVLTMQDGALR